MPRETIHILLPYKGEGKLNGSSKLMSIPGEGSSEAKLEVRRKDMIKEANAGLELAK